MNSISNWVTSGYFSALGYLSFGENDGQITRTMRIYKSEKDWFGTQQTLVLDKNWLKNLTASLQNLLEIITDEIDQQHAGSIEVSLQLENSVKMLKSFLPLLQNIYSLYSSPESRTIFEYFFGSNVGKSAVSFKNSSHLYNDLIVYISQKNQMGSTDDNDVHSNMLIECLDNLFQQENCDHLLEMGIMFGFYPALIIP